MGACDVVNPVCLRCCLLSLFVGCMEHSDSESDFELQAVDPGLADLSDELSETASEEENNGPFAWEAQGGY